MLPVVVFEYSIENEKTKSFSVENIFIRLTNNQVREDVEEKNLLLAKNQTDMNTAPSMYTLH